MKKQFLAFAVLCLIGAMARPVAAKTVSGTVTMAIDLSAHDPGKAARLWLPYPVSDANQVITDVHIDGDYANAAVYTDRVHQTPMLYAEWKNGATHRTLRFRFTVTRNEVIRRDFPAREAAWSPRDYALYLQGTRLGPVDGKVKKIADRIVAGKTTVRDKARAIYDWVVDNTYRDPDTRGCGIGDVERLLVRPGGKCADISSVFVALARAAGVPARDVLGIRLGKTETQDITTWQHCWAEFFLPGYGWVPVDPADVRKMMLVQHLHLGDAKTKAYRAYFWGGIDAYRVRLSVGRDLELNPPQAGKPLNYLMYPYAEIGGKPLDWLNPKTFRYTITYHR